MILTFLFNFFFDFLNGLINLLPVGSIPTGIGDSLTYIVGVMNTFNWFFPLDTLFTVLGITVGFELVVVSYHFIMWILRKIPFFHIT